MSATPPSDKSNLPVAIGPVVTHEAQNPTSDRLNTSAGFKAQILSGGELRGLKGGLPLLKAAKKTYLTNEYSGENDRRPKPGQIKIKDI